MRFPGSSDGKESACSAGDQGLIPGSGGFPGGHGNPLQYSCQENPVDRRAWWATVYGVAKSWTQLRTDAKAETLVLWPPHAKSWLIGKDPDAGRDWGQEEKGMTEDEMAGWNHQLEGHEFWENSGNWWWTGRPGVLRFMGSQRVGHDWATELTELTDWATNTHKQL